MQCDIRNKLNPTLRQSGTAERPEKRPRLGRLNSWLEKITPQMNLNSSDYPKIFFLLKTQKKNQSFFFTVLENVSEFFRNLSQLCEIWQFIKPYTTWPLKQNHNKMFIATPNCPSASASKSFIGASIQSLHLVTRGLKRFRYHPEVWGD